MATPNKPDQNPKSDASAHKRPTQESLKKLKVAANRVSWERIDSTVLRLLLLVALSALISYYLTPGFSTGDNDYDESWIGRVATSDVRSPADYNIEDIAATEAKRDEEELAVLPVYDFQSKMGDTINVRLEEAFKGIQTSLYKFLVDNILIPQDEKKESKKAKRQKVAAEKDVEPTSEDLAAKQAEYMATAASTVNTLFAETMKNAEMSKDLREQILGMRSEFNRTVQAVIPEELYTKLFAYHFSDELLVSIQQMISDVMKRKIINEKELMEKGQNGTITVRVLTEATGPPSEYVMNDVTPILNIKEVSQSLWRYTTVLSNLGEGQRRLVKDVAGHLIRPNLFYNRSMTLERKSRARERVKTMLIPIKKGEMIIRDGERFEGRHITVLHGIQRELMATNPNFVWLGYTLFFFLLIGAMVHFAIRNVRKANVTFRDFVMMSFLIMGYILIVKSVGIVAEALDSVLPTIEPVVYYLAIPVAVGAAMVRIVINSETAAMFSIFTAILFGMLTTQPYYLSVYALIMGLVAADGVGQCRTRATLIFAGLRVSLVGMLVVIFHTIVSGNMMTMTFAHSILAVAVAGLVTGIILTGLTPLIEFAFGYTTDIKLLELANLNHPLLKRLIVQAPGTYHHSIIVGSLVEAAAESIHANPLLARVSAYYHDIGKVKTPQYFGENQQEGQNPHDTLSPSMSVLILQSHVKEGVELAKQFKLGPRITDIIGEHHGTSLIRYFYQRALDQSEKNESGPIDEQEFRYPGQKPQTREAGLVMLADSVEAATRSLEDYSPERIRGMVQKIINGIFRDEQLNECELTLKDLHHIARSFTQILVSLYHNRPQYPGTSRPTERNANGRASAQPAKKTADEKQKVEKEDDEDIKRLGMQ